MPTVRTARPADVDALLAVGRAAWRATFEPLAGPAYVEAGLARWWTPEAVRADVKKLIAVGRGRRRWVQWLVENQVEVLNRGRGTEEADLLNGRAGEVGVEVADDQGRRVLRTEDRSALGTSKNKPDRSIAVRMGIRQDRNGERLRRLPRLEHDRP